MLKIVIALAVVATFALTYVQAQGGIMGIQPPVRKPYIDKGPGTASHESGDGRRPPGHGKKPDDSESHESGEGRYPPGHEGKAKFPGSHEEFPGHGRPDFGPHRPSHFPLFPPRMCYQPSSTFAPPVSGGPSSPAPIDVAASSAAPESAPTTFAPVEGFTDAQAPSTEAAAASAAP